jgi:hypothetical protein
MQCVNVSIISAEIDTIFSAVKNVLCGIIPINTCFSAATGNDKVDNGREILNACLYLKNKLNIGVFNPERDSDDVECFIDLKSMYIDFVSGCF